MINHPTMIYHILMSDSNYSSDSDTSVSSFEEVASVMKGGKKSSKKSTKKSTKKKSSKKSTKKKSSKKSTKKKTSKSATDKPKKKRELNPIMKRMNVLRNEHIGLHIGTRAPMKTIPPFKLVLAEARNNLKLNEKDKNTVEVVNKAIELFNASPDTYCV
tara:strand:+ start:789 stop:1265 length:477 start_codon:yes stop_codon:yes gene_type:complete